MNCSGILQASYTAQDQESTLGTRVTSLVARKVSRTLTPRVEEAGTNILYNTRLAIIKHGNSSQWILHVPVIIHLFVNECLAASVSVLCFCKMRSTLLGRLFRCGKKGACSDTIRSLVMFIIQKIFNENGWTRIVVGKENLSLWKPKRHMWRAVSFIPHPFYRRENNPHY